MTWACKDCRFVDDRKEVLVCRRYPYYVETSADDWCGEFKEPAQLPDMVIADDTGWNPMTQPHPWVSYEYNINPSWPPNWWDDQPVEPAVCDGDSCAAAVQHMNAIQQAEIMAAAQQKLADDNAELRKSAGTPSPNSEIVNLYSKIPADGEISSEKGNVKQQSGPELYDFMAGLPNGVSKPADDGRHWLYWNRTEDCPLEADRVHLMKHESGTCAPRWRCVRCGYVIWSRDHDDTRTS